MIYIEYISQYIKLFLNSSIPLIMNLLPLSQIRLFGSICFNENILPSDIDIAIILKTRSSATIFYYLLRHFSFNYNICMLSNYNSLRIYTNTALPFHYIITSEEELKYKREWRRNIYKGIILLSNN